MSTLDNRILVVDDEPAVLAEYARAFGGERENAQTSDQLSRLGSELFGEDKREANELGFSIHTCRQGKAAVEAVEASVSVDERFAIVFLDLDMPPGISGVEAGQRIREADEAVNIVIVTGSGTAEPDVLRKLIPPSEKLFFFKKPFHTQECLQMSVALCGNWHRELKITSANASLESRIQRDAVQMQELAFTDFKTKLLNRRGILVQLGAMIAKERTRQASVATLLIGIKRFGFLNETLGHEKGNQLLAAVGKRIQATLRADDILGRTGAHEFACVTRGYADPQAIRSCAQRICDAFKRPFTGVDAELYVDIAIGVSSYPSHGASAESIFQCAESALNRSKKHFGNEIILYDQEMTQRASKRLGVEVELRAALENGLIQPFYQPQFDAFTKQCIGAEALARWIKPNGDVIPPGLFVSIAEEIGLSRELFQVVLDRVCSDLSIWGRQGWHAPVSINISAHELMDNQLAESLCDRLERRGLSPAQIKLELTESVLMDDLELGRQRLARLVDRGIQVEVDDFGTGYSSLSYLADLPVRALKIDRSFVAPLADSKRYQRLVSAIIGLARALNLEVVAEGVETKAQQDWLCQNRCNTLQGYLLGKPMPASEYCALVGLTESDEPKTARLADTQAP